MRERNCWLIVLSLVAAMVLVCGSAAETIPIPLPVAMVVGLGFNAALLLWEHREKMADILDAPRQHHHRLR